VENGTKIAASCFGTIDKASSPHERSDMRDLTMGRHPVMRRMGFASLTHLTLAPETKDPLNHRG
jgi:hypothetical protein